MAMKEVTITEFKAKCHGIIEQVRKTRRPIRVTRFGKPLAEILPTSPKKRRPAGSVTRKEGLWET
jgi:prevent-host-death family protein